MKCIFRIRNFSNVVRFRACKSLCVSPFNGRVFPSVVSYTPLSNIFVRFFAAFTNCIVAFSVLSPGNSCSRRPSRGVRRDLYRNTKLLSNGAKDQSEWNCDSTLCNIPLRNVSGGTVIDSSGTRLSDRFPSKSGPPTAYGKVNGKALWS